MARSIWTGAISFGLVTVPVKLYSAVNRKTVRFHQLNGKTGVRIAQKRVDPSTGDEVAYEDIVKGFELTPDRYVVIEPGELEALEPKKTQDDRDRGLRRARRHRPDLLRPPVLPRARHRRRQALPAAARGDARDRPRRDRAGGHPLQGAARRAAPDGRRRAGHGDDALRRRGRRPGHDRRDRRPPPTSRRPSASSTSPSSSSSRWPAPSSPAKYHDTYREEVLDLIERKAAGEEIAVQPAADEEDEPVPDLMAALKASLDAVRDKDGRRSNGGGQGRRRRPSQGQAKPRARKKAAKQELVARPRRVRPPRSGRHDRHPHPAPAPRRLLRPGHRAPAPRARLPLPRRATASPSTTPRSSRRIHELVDPAGVGGRVDLPVPGRPHPGHRHRRGRAQAVPLPPALARAARHGEVRRHGRLRPHAAAAARARRRRPRRAATSSPTTASARAPRACSTAASSASAARTTRCATRATAWRR